MRRLRILLLGLVAAAPVAADWSDALKRFRAEYRREATPEARRRALSQLGHADVPEAAELLFKLWRTLHRDATRLRLDVFAATSRMRELRNEKVDARREASRRAAIQALDEKQALLTRRLTAVELEQSSILDALGNLESDEALDWLATEGLRRAREPILILTVAHRIARSKRTGTLITALEKVKQPEQMIPLLQALGRLGPELGDGVATVVGFLEHKDWAVRVAAAHALAAAARPEGVGPLVGAMAREIDRSRAQREMTRALTRLTGQKFGPFPDLWQRWWRDHRDRVMEGRVPLGAGRLAVDEKEPSRFYGIPQAADRIIYVFDRSGSMEVSMAHPRWIDGAAVPARDDEDSRFTAAQRELLRAVRTLRKGSAYAVILYSDHAEPLHEALVPATPEHHARLEQQLNRIGPMGSTNIYEALDAALRMANVHGESTRGEARADAIILVSDGSPTTSKGEIEDPERTLQAVREWNTLRRVAIHTIGIGAQHSSDFLKQLAEENGGTYYAVTPKKR